MLITRFIDADYLKRIGSELDLEATLGWEKSSTTTPLSDEKGVVHFTEQLEFPTPDDTPLTLLITKDFSNELQGLSATRFRIFVFSLLASLLAMAVVYCIVGYFLHPLRQLRTWLQEFNEGKLGVEDLNTNIIRQNNKKNELGFIAHAALATIQELETARGALQQMHSDLEQLVQQRTQELLRKATELEEEILERERAEARVRGLKNHLQNIFDSVRCTLLGIDGSGVVNFVNAHAESFSGRSYTELCGESLVSVLDIYGLPGEEILLRSQSGEEQWQSCRYIAHARGQQLHLDVTTYPFSFGTDTGQIVRIDDVSRHVHLEQELFKSEKLKSVGLLAGGLAHDFNNFLSAILGNISLARIDGGFNASVRGLLMDAEKACIAAKELTGQLLTFSKGGEPIKELHDVADPARKAARLAVLDGAHTLTCTLPDTLWPAMIDRVQIERVVRNIVSNAAQVLDQGESIALHCENIKSVGRNNSLHLSPGPYIRLSISDSGPGMEPEVLEHIFDPYFSTKSDGYGLGLAICHSIIKKHQGAIAVDSSPGKGTTFSLYLPAYPDKTLPSQSAQQSVHPVSLRILVMDDDLMVQNALSSMLEVLGHQVVFARDGEEAIGKHQLAMENHIPFDLIFMDLVIPNGMGGREAVRVMTELDPRARVIVCSGYCSDPVLARYEDYGFYAVLKKPFQFQEVEQVIAQVVERGVKE